MKVIHINGYFMNEMMYQENYFMQALPLLGVKSYMISGKNDFRLPHNKNNFVHLKKVERYHNSIIIRVNHIFELVNKLVFFIPLINIFTRIKPDFIFFHGVSPNIIYGLIYKIINPKVSLQIDFHTGYANSGKSNFSRIFHFFNRLLLKIASSSLDRYFCVAPEFKEFAHKEYKIPNEKLEILPLPGIFYEDIEYDEKRNRFRERHNISSDLVFIHAGKMPQDKETQIALEAFFNIKNNNIKLFLCGSADKEFENEIQKYADKDERIKYLGWMSYEDLSDAFCGGDILLQPGSLSQVFIDAICCRNYLILDNTPQGKFLTNLGNGILSARNLCDVRDKILESINFFDSNGARKKLKEAALEYDYKKIVKKTLC